MQIRELNCIYAGDYSEVQFFIIYLRIWTTEKVIVAKLHVRISAAKMQRNSSGSERLFLFRHSSPKRIEWFIEDQAFSRRMIWLLPRPSPLQSVCSTSDTHEEREIETTCPDGRGGRGGGGAKSYLGEGKPGPLCIIQYSFLFTTSRAFSPFLQLQYEAGQSVHTRDTRCVASVVQL